MGNQPCKFCRKRLSKEQLEQLKKCIALNKATDQKSSSQSSEQKIEFNSKQEYQFKTLDYEAILKDQAYSSCQSLPSSVIQKKAGSSNSNLVAKQKRLLKEYEILATQTPVYSTNAIFSKSDESNTDHIRSIITGAEGTPYAYGVFLFDTLCHDTFPTNPPEMKILTTGAGTVRFNPNLYNNGYVCLSLLGTWSGNQGEVWQPQTSNIALVLMSIQSLVMNEGVLFQEPAYISYKKLPEYASLNNGYCNIVKYATVKYAMNEMLTKPPKEFEDIIKVHFYINKEEILKTVEKWIDDADKLKADYDRLVNSHNYTLAAKFKSGSYKKCLEEEVKNLRQNLQNVTYSSIATIPFVQKFIKAKLEKAKAQKKEIQQKQAQESKSTIKTEEPQQKEEKGTKGQANSNDFKIAQPGRKNKNKIGKKIKAQ